MKPTTSWMLEHYQEFNNRYFRLSLPPIPLEISHASTKLGYVKFRRSPYTQEVQPFYLALSDYFDRTELELENTLVHEMIHLYLHFTGRTDPTPHGPNFMSELNRINAAGTHTISVSEKVAISQEKKTQRNGQNFRRHYIIVSYLKDGNIGITVCASTRVFEMHRIFSKWDIVERFEWWFIYDEYFNRFPVSRTPNIYKFTQELLESELYPHGVRLVCDGSTLSPAPIL